MQEAFLHHIWQHKKFTVTSLKTTTNEEIQLINSGQLNSNAGPDFLNAQLKIANQHWAGNVEIHIKSSDWYVHQHEKDRNYDNVILHVVWEHDVEVFQSNNQPLPTLELKHIVDSSLVNTYNSLLFNKPQFINCEKDINEISDFIFNNWMEALFIERLEKKASIINTMLKRTNNNWEAVLFNLLFKSFGLKVNGEAFFQISKSIDFNIVRKLYGKQTQMEAIFLGQANLLEEDALVSYSTTLTNEYNFLISKFKLKNDQNIKPHFFRLRPVNFPTIRLSQLATLYAKEHTLFNKLVQCKNLNDYYDVLQVAASTFWQTHYTFNTASKKSLKKTTKSFIDLILINAILPMRFAYSKAIGNDESEELISLISKIKREKNSVVSSFETLRAIDDNAMFSQSIIELKSTYCDKNKCLQCAIGNELLSQN